MIRKPTSRAAKPGIVVCLVFVLAILSACTQDPETLRLVTPRQPYDKIIADELVRVFADNPRIRLTLVPHIDMGESSLQALLENKGDLALVSNGEDFVTGVETVIPFYPTVLHIAYRDDLKPESRRDLLIGTTVFAGPPGSPSREMMEKTVHRLGIPVNDVHFVESLSPKPDVVVVFAPIMIDLMEGYTEDYRLFSIGSVEQLGHGSLAESLSLLNPHFQPFVLPTDLYPKVVSKPVVTVGVDKLLVTRKEIPQAVIYDLISEILRLKPALSAMQPSLFHKLSGDFDAGSSTFVIHPGSQAYIERDAPSIYERYSGVAEVIVTLFFSLASALYAGLRIYKIRRKNRIDTFYKKAMAIRKSVSADSATELRANAIAEIRQLQETAFDQLVDEKLAADESFRIFITLCHDVIAELST